MENSTLSALSDAMDAASMRHQVLANNIANARTPGFRASDVAFSARVKSLQDEEGAARTTVEARQDVRFNGTAYVDVGQEMAQMTSNAVHYQALASLAASNFHDMQSVLQDGRGG